MFVALALGIALLQDPAAQAGGQAGAQAAQPAQTEAEREAAEREAYLDEVVCRREHIVGTNRPQRVCQTRRQWDRLGMLSRENMREDRLQQPVGRGEGEVMRR